MTPGFWGVANQVLTQLPSGFCPILGVQKSAGLNLAS